MLAIQPISQLIKLREQHGDDDCGYFLCSLMEIFDDSSEKWEGERCEDHFLWQLLGMFSLTFGLIMNSAYILGGISNDPFLPGD